MKEGYVVETTTQKGTKGVLKLAFNPVPVKDGHVVAGWKFVGDEPKFVVRRVETFKNAFTTAYGTFTAKENGFWEAHGREAHPFVRGNPSLFFGADPEIFVTDEKGELIPAWEFLPDKAKKSPNVGRPSYYGVVDRYWDGFGAEFTMDARTCFEQVTDRIYAGLRDVLSGARAKFPKAKLTIQNVFEIPKKTLLEVDEKYVRLGCEPSLNVYDEPPMMVENPRLLGFRSAGGHIHISPQISWSDGMQNRFKMGVGKEGPWGEDKISHIVRAMDQLLAVACVSLFENLDIPSRRQFYGRCGEYRLPVHGIEYRVLSNAWLCHPGICHLVLNTARMAAKFGAMKLNPALAASDDRVRGIVNNCDVTEARKLIKKNEAVYKALYETQYGDVSTVNASFSAISGPVNNLIDPTNLERNWFLTGGWKGGAVLTWRNLAHKKEHSI